MKGKILTYGLLMLGSLLCLSSGFAQSETPDRQQATEVQPDTITQPETLVRPEMPNEPLRTYRGLVYRSDTLPVMVLPPVNIYDVNKYSYLKARKYRRTIRNVKRAYPYARIAHHRLGVLARELEDMKSEKERRQYRKEAEKQIMHEFEDEVKRLTITQGIILVKLIDRETGNTSYEVIQEIRGKMTAFFWQGIARLFGNNLKLQYEPEGEDKLIEDIVMAIEYGFI